MTESSIQQQSGTLLLIPKNDIDPLGQRFVRKLWGEEDIIRAGQKRVLYACIVTDPKDVLLRDVGENPAPESNGTP